MVTLKGYTANMLGVSTDQKPTDADINTIFRELNTNKYFYFDGTTWNEIPSSGGSSFEPTQAQLDAMNSGATTEKINQISTNESNISLNADNILLNTENGKANYINAPDTTISEAGYVFNNLACNIPAGNYYLKYTSTQESSGNIAFIITDINNTNVCDVTLLSKTGDNIFSITLSGAGASCKLYSVKAGTFSNFMIIPKTLYDAGFTAYQPYTMSNAEITAWILSQS